mmetsp:Transcript_23919/g.53220  ORF Transcript_23919/g.53220 Transcript_23919/m.53220 type:complete len:85 (+) Transcript_23919:2117-2371(+)
MSSTQRLRSSEPKRHMRTLKGGNGIGDGFCCFSSFSLAYQLVAPETKLQQYKCKTRQKKLKQLNESRTEKSGTMNDDDDERNKS